VVYSDVFTLALISRALSVTSVNSFVVPVNSARFSRRVNGPAFEIAVSLCESGSAGVKCLFQIA